jgi:hypothetical protein
VGDYVPCLFDQGEEIAMRAEELANDSSPTLTQDSAANLVNLTSAAILKLSAKYDSKAVADLDTEYKKDISPADLKALTRDQALVRIDSAVTQAWGSVKGENFYYSSSPPVDTSKLKGDDLTKAQAQATAQREQAGQAALADAQSAVAGAAKSFQNNLKFPPPDDVSCSMSVMPFEETHDIFGRRVADEFVGIQVTVRNLNTKNEFLIHDIRVAIDTGVDVQYFGRFQAGRDKLLVRAVAQEGQWEDPRNRWVNILEATGAIAGGASVIAGTVQFTDAVAIFQGTFIQGVNNIWPDHTVAQLNNVNDFVFSASSTSKVIVPVQGAVPLVTFIAEKPIEQLPFAWCGYTGKSGPWFHKAKQYCDFPSNPDPKDQEMYKATHEKPYLSTDGIGGWDDLAYKKWKPAALRMLQQNTYVVVGGVHIQELASQPSVSNLTCPSLSNGAVDVSQTTNGVVNCTMTGSGLNLASSVTLEKDTSKISGKITPATDGSSATLQFSPDDLGDNAGVYSLYLTYKAGSQGTPTDIDSGEKVTLAKQPIITSADAVDRSKATGTPPAAPLVLHGKDLDQFNSVSLVYDSGTRVTGSLQPPTGATTDGTTATFTFAGLQPTAKTPPECHVEYSSKAGGTKQISPSPAIAVTVK